MRIGITEFPKNGVEIKALPSGLYQVSLFKNVEETIFGNEIRITADVVRLEMNFCDENDIVNNFDFYFEKARILELNAEKAKVLANIENELIKTDYKCWKHADGDLSDEEYAVTKEIMANLRAKYKNVEKAETLEQMKGEAL